MSFKATKRRKVTKDQSVTQELTCWCSFWCAQSAIGRI